jgi:hypothetical protein
VNRLIFDVFGVLVMASLTFLVVGVLGMEPFAMVHWARRVTDIEAEADLSR